MNQENDEKKVNEKENEEIENEEKKEENFEENESQEEMENEEVENHKEDSKEEEKQEGKNLSEMEKSDLIDYIFSFEEKINELEEEKEKYLNRLQRLKADFNNYRNRTKREKEGLALEAKLELFNEILPVIDNFERALSSESDENDLKTGVEMIYKQLVNNLKSQGLKKIETVGEEFDHKYHEAIMQVEDCDYDSGIIVEEMQKGY
ncbi:MAG: nucleotide exchange factor GrpE, partial [Bacillota bacterium]